MIRALLTFTILFIATVSFAGEWQHQGPGPLGNFIKFQAYDGALKVTGIKGYNGGDYRWEAVVSRNRTVEEKLYLGEGNLQRGDGDCYYPIRVELRFSYDKKRKIEYLYPRLYIPYRFSAESSTAGCWMAQYWWQETKKPFFRNY